MIYVYWTLFSIVIAWIASQCLSEKYLNSDDEMILDKKAKPNLLAKFFLLISFLPFFFLAALRYFVGTDYQTYVYNQIPAVLNNGWTENVAPLYKLVILIGKDLGSTQWVFVLTSFITVAFLFLPILYRSRSYSLSVFLITFSTFYSFTLNGMRQSIAGLIVFWGLNYIYTKKPIFIFYCVIGLLFHTSALFLIAVALLAAISSKKIRSGIIICMLPICYVLAPLMFNVVRLISSKIGYSYYFETDGLVTFDKALFLTLLITLLVAVVVEIQATKLSNYDQLLLKIIGVGALLLALTRTIPNAGRLTYLFLPVEIVLIPNLVSNIRGRDLRVVIRILVVLLFVALFVYRIIDKNFNGTLPYQIVTNWDF